MSNQFLLIIKKQDEDKFRLFKNGKYYNKATNEILKKNNNKYVWGIHKGIINNSIWSKIRKNDKIFLTVEEETFKISGIISKKIKNLKFGKLIYPAAIDKKQINYFLFFDKLDACRIPYDVLKNKSKSKIFVEGIYKIETSDTNKLAKATLVKKLPLKNIIGQPKRKRRSGMGIVRNPTKVRQLKTLYDNKCQIIQCSFRLEYYSKNKNVFYSEVNHYNPLKKQSDDDFGNMLVLCPNHHKEFDYSVKFVDMDGITIIDGQGKLTGETLQFFKNHKLDIKNIASQLGQ